MLSMFSEIKLEDKQNQFSNFNKFDGPFLINGGGAMDLDMFKRKSEWSMIQNAKYLAFIDINYKKMESMPHAKLWELYKQMSSFVKSRNFRQCKSHHQKLIQEHKTIANLTNFLLSKNSQLQNLVNKEKKSLKEILNINSLPQFAEMNEVQQQCLKRNKIQLEDTGKSYFPQQQQQNQIPSLFPSQANKYQQLYHNYNFLGSSREAEWKECHQLFVQWATRVKSLMLAYPFM